MGLTSSARIATKVGKDSAGKGMTPNLGTPGAERVKKVSIGMNNQLSRCAAAGQTIQVIPLAGGWINRIALDRIRNIETNEAE